MTDQSFINLAKRGLEEEYVSLKLEADLSNNIERALVFSASTKEGHPLIQNILIEEEDEMKLYFWSKGNERSSPVMYHLSLFPIGSPLNKTSDIGYELIKNEFGVSRVRVNYILPQHIYYQIQNTLGNTPWYICAMLGGKTEQDKGRELYAFTEVNTSIVERGSTSGLTSDTRHFPLVSSFMPLTKEYLQGNESLRLLFKPRGMVLNFKVNNTLKEQVDVVGFRVKSQDAVFFAHYDLSPEVHDVLENEYPDLDYTKKNDRTTASVFIPKSDITTLEPSQYTQGFHTLWFLPKNKAQSIGIEMEILYRITKDGISKTYWSASTSHRFSPKTEWREGKSYTLNDRFFSVKGRPDFPKDIAKQYLAAQIEVTKVAASPSSLSSFRVTLESLSETKKELWKLWEYVNADRMSKGKLSNPSNRKQELVWSIPSNERMKIKYFSKGTKPRDGYPLFVHLHGGGAQRTNTAWGSRFHDREWDTSVQLSEKYNDGPSLYFVPRMADDRKGRWYLYPQQMAFKRVFQLAVLSGHVDPLRFYITGISEGGYGSHRLAMLMPDYFAGIGVMAAAEHVHAPQNLRNTAYYLTVGEKDEAFNRSKYAKAWGKSLEKYQRENPGDFVSRVWIQSGRGHGIKYGSTTPWLKEYRRRVYPDRIAYRYYNITPEYAPSYNEHGVYYIDFRGIERESPKEAALDIDVQKQGNTYRVLTSNKKHIRGHLGLFIDKVDFSKPVVLIHNDIEVFNSLVEPNQAAMLESIALWGDPLRIFSAKVTFEL